MRSPRHIGLPKATLAILVLVGLLPGRPAAAVLETSADRIENRVLELINGARAQNGKGAWVMHSGLRQTARWYSGEMSRRGGLSHDGFEGRVTSASPDPAESNGAPDDGFEENGLAACEDLGYWYPAGTTQMPEEEVAKAFYQMWMDSPPHRDCLMDVWGYGLNVAGVGIFEDSRGAWWGTLEVVRDFSPPGSGSQPPMQVTPAPTAPPTPKPATPRPTSKPRPQPTPVVTAVPTAPPTPVATVDPGCSFDFWLLRVDRCG